MPGLRQVAEAVDMHHDFQIFTEQRLGAYLYHDWYLPLSNPSVHPSAAALSRYYKFRSSIILKRPWQVIPRRGAIRVADGAIAFLLVAILETRSEDAQWARSYAERQITTANIPIVMLFARVALGQGLGILARTAYAGLRNRVAFDPSIPKERRVLAMRAFLRAASPEASDEELDESAATLLDVMDDAMNAAANIPKASGDVTGSS